MSKLSLLKTIGILLNEGDSGNFPPGFNSSDLINLDDFFGGSIEKEVKEDDQLGNVEFRSDSELKKLMSKAEKGEKLSKGDPYLHTTTVKGIKDESGNVLDAGKLMSLLSKRPSNILKTDSNLKMIKSNVATITLPKYRGLIHDEKTNELKIVNTCPSAHKCIVGCYAGKGFYVVYKQSSEKSAQILTFLFNDYKGWKDQVINEIKTLENDLEDSGNKAVIRWHDSGDFFSPDYLDIAIDIANSTPNTLHYAYTKSVSMVKSKTLPSNFLTRFSYGGLEDKLINKQSDLHSDVIKHKSDKDKAYEGEVLINFKKYYDLKKTSDGKSKWVIKSEKDLMDFKNEIAEKYKIDVNTVLTFQEVMNKPQSDKPIWNVIVTPSNADNAAFRRDVLGIYLLYH